MSWNAKQKEGTFNYTLRGMTTSHVTVIANFATHNLVRYLADYHDIIKYQNLVVERLATSTQVQETVLQVTSGIPIIGLMTYYEVLDDIDDDNDYQLSIEDLVPQTPTTPLTSKAVLAYKRHATVQKEKVHDKVN